MIGTNKELVAQLEKVNFRIASLEAIEERRERTTLEEEELDRQYVSRRSLNDVIKKTELANQERVQKLSSSLSLFSAIAFSILSAYIILTILPLVAQGNKANEIFIAAMSLTITLTISVGSILFFKGQTKKGIRRLA